MYARFQWKGKYLRELSNALEGNDWSVIWVLSINWQKPPFSLVLNNMNLTYIREMKKIYSLFIKVNFLLRKIFRRTLNEAISLVEIDVTFNDWRRTLFPDIDYFPHNETIILLVTIIFFYYHLIYYHLMKQWNWKWNAKGKNVIMQNLNFHQEAHLGPP